MTTTFDVSCESQQKTASKFPKSPVGALKRLDMSHSNVLVLAAHMCNLLP